MPKLRPGQKPSSPYVPPTDAEGRWRSRADLHRERVLPPHNDKFLRALSLSAAYLPAVRDSARCRSPLFEGPLRPCRIPIRDPYVETCDLQHAGDVRMGTTDDKVSPSRYRLSPRSVNGPEARGVDKGELVEVDHDKRSGGAGQMFGEIPNGRSIKLPTQGDDATSVEGVGSDAKEICYHAATTLLFVTEAVRPSSRGDTCFPREPRRHR